MSQPMVMPRILPDHWCCKESSHCAMVPTVSISKLRSFKVQILWIVHLQSTISINSLRTHLIDRQELRSM